MSAKSGRFTAKFAYKLTIKEKNNENNGPIEWRSL